MEDKPFDTAGEVQGDSRGVLQACDRESPEEETRGSGSRRLALEVASVECIPSFLLNYPEEMVEPEQCAQYSVYSMRLVLGAKSKIIILREIMAHNHTEYGVQEYGIE